MVIELSFKNRKKMRRRVKMLIEYMSIEEMLKKNPKLLISLIENEKIGSEYLEEIKNLDE